jgi:hypothetical protein
MDEAVDRTGREILVDEPDWKDVLRVVPIEVTRATSRLTEFANRLHVVKRATVEKRRPLDAEDRGAASFPGILGLRRP